MKKALLFTLIVSSLSLPFAADAQVIFPNRGGTGTATVPTIGQVLVGQANGIYAPQATSTLGIRASLLGLTTADLTEGSNLYFTGARAREAISETVTGLDYDNGTGVLSQTSGYSLPRTASTTEWATAFGWGNHASAGYLTAVATSTVRGMFSASSPLSYSSGTGAFSFTNPGYIIDLSGFDTGDLTEGSNLYYTPERVGTDAPNVTLTGTPDYITISGQQITRGTVDVSDDTDLSVSATGLQLSGDAVALASGYVIPLSASTTQWATAYGWGNHASAGYLTAVTADSPLSGSGTSGSHLVLSTSGTWSGNAGTATALAANGANCSAGSFPLGVTAAGAAENCTDAWTEAENTAAGYTSNTGTVTSVSATVPTGLSISGSPVTTSGTLAFSLTSGYVIPLSASTTQWATAYGWGNHASAGYLTVVAWGDIAGTLSDQNDLQSALDAKQSTLTTGNLTENISGLEFNATRSVIGGAAQLSLSTGYVVPLSASTTEWATAFSWGNHASAGYLDSGDIGASVQAYDSDLTTYAGITPSANVQSLLAAADYAAFAALIEAAIESAIDTLSNLTSVGTIVTGVWNATPIGIAYGGLGAAFTDPNVDQLMFWDDSADKITGIDTLAGAAISGTTLTINDVTCSDCLGATEIAGLGTADISGLDISDDTNLAAGRSLTLSGDSVDADAELYTDTKCVWWENPVAGDDFKSVWFAKQATTITSLWCESDQTVTAMFQVDDGSPADVDSSDLTCDSTPPEDTSLNGDATLASGDRLDIDVASVASTPTWVSMCFTFTYDD